MDRLQRRRLSIFAGCLLLAAVPARSLLAAPPVLPQATVFAPSHDGKPVQCNDAYYGYLPGLVDFCLGLHQWQRGRYENGIEFLKLAAGWGSKSAQFMLGMIHYNGRHVPVDRALGIAWLELANERHNDPRIGTVAKSAVKWATPAEQQRGQQLFQTMRAKYGDNVAAARAWTQYEHQVRYAAYLRGGGLAEMTSRNCMFLPAAQAGAGGFEVSQPAQAEGFAARGKKPRIDASGVCVPFVVFDRGAQHLSKTYFHGWEGHVTVGDLQKEPATSAPAH